MVVVVGVERNTIPSRSTLSPAPPPLVLLLLLPWIPQSQAVMPPAPEYSTARRVQEAWVWDSSPCLARSARLLWLC